MSQEFEALSRKAARGELSPAERDLLDAFLREHPTRRADAEWDEAFSSKLADKIEAMPAMPGWERTEKALQTAAGVLPARPESRHALGILDRISDWIGSSLGLALNVQAIAAALILVQAGVIGLLAWPSTDTEYSQIRAGAQEDAPRGPLLRVSFKEDLSERGLRQMLADIGGEIVGGPGQLGIYLVRVKTGELGAAAERLRATGKVELVERFEAK